MSLKNNKVVFLDRDGVVNKEIGYLHKIEEFEFIEGIFKSLRNLIYSGYKLIIVTNQSGIGRGMYNIEQFHTLNNWMLKKFKEKNIFFLDVLFCPHMPEDYCECRKPKPGLFLSAIKKYKIDTKASWMIGDTENDILAAREAGIMKTVLVRSGHKVDDKKTKASFVIDSIKDIAEVINS